MQTRKQWLLSEGHIQPSQAGRGRISAENMALIQEAYKSGTRFSDWEPSNTEIHSGNAVARNSVPKRVVAEFPIYYPEDTYKVVEANGTLRSLKEGCNNCRVSLVQCRCDAPRIVARDGRGGVLVSIVRK
jgi:hypothetical protein